MISIYSVISSIIFYSSSLVILFILRRKTDFIARYAISTLLFLSLLSMVRLLVPIDFDSAYVIRSYTALPKLIEFLEAKYSVWPLSVVYTVLAIWVVGSIIHGAKICRIERKAYKARRIYPKIRSDQLKRVSAEFDKAYSIIISPKVSMPYTVGIFKPTIYLPYIKYSDTELYYIILHEVQHIKSRDNLNRLIFLVVETIFWWNPLAHVAVNEFEYLTEYKCDAKLASTMDEATVDEYLQTIVNVIDRLAPDEDKAKPKLALMFAQKDNAKQRFEVLLRRNDRRPKHIRYAVLIVMLLIFVMSYFVIIQPYYPLPSPSSIEDIYITSENSSILFVGDEYLLVYNDIVVGDLSEEELNNPPFNDLIIVGG